MDINMSTAKSQVVAAQLPWAVRVAAAFGAGMSASIACAGTVTTCVDSNVPGSGSLRAVVKAASNNETINLAALNCSQITLTLGAIPISVSNLTLQGPSAAHAPLIISGNLSYRVFFHSPFPLPDTGTLSINNLTIADGKYDAFGTHAHGGCIYSSAAVELTNSVVTDCHANETGGGVNGEGARGGGIYALGNVTLTNSTVSNSRAYSKDSGYSARGGGIVAANVSANFSTITGNSAVAGSAATSYAGGIEAGNVSITASTIDTNQADRGAGIYLFGDPSNPTVKSNIVNSTISANTAKSGVGGVAMSFQASLNLLNSTIAFNRSTSGAGGLSLEIGNTLAMYSSIVAENSTVSGPAADLDISHSSGVTGSHNLVMQTDYSPSGLIATTGNPRLVRLGFHGGITRTCAVQSFSPALEQGYLYTFLFDDQRGLGYERSVGFGPDIGAYERQDGDDEIFADSFDY